MACSRASAPAAVLILAKSSFSRCCSSSPSPASDFGVQVPTRAPQFRPNVRISFINTVPRDRAGIRLSRRCASLDGASNEGVYLPDLQVPRAWVSPEAAIQESEWLRGALHQWLDDEYCPEPANDEISRRCAKVYYYCLLEEQLDVGDILMQMVRDLETFSFKQSFHGAFSSANAAIELITKRMRAREPSSN